MVVVFMMIRTIASSILRRRVGGNGRVNGDKPEHVLGGLQVLGLGFKVAV